MIYERIFVCDVDGCISDDQWRFEKVDHSIADPDKRYSVYHENAEFDYPANKSVYDFYSTSNPLIITAMPERYRKERLRWLFKHFSFRNSENLLMRPEGNHVCSRVLKVNLLKEWISKRQKPVLVEMAIDDRQDVLEAYSLMGIPTKLVYCGNYQRTKE